MTHSRRPITRVEWRWVLILAMLVLTAASVPYVVAWSRETPERTFSGCITLIEDCYSYLAKMRQGAEGAWLFHIPYTPEEHPGTLFFLFHLGLGKIANLLPGGGLTSRLILVYHAARILFGLGFLLTLYRFLAVLVSDVAVRRLAWLMVALGGGLGWLLAALEKPIWLGAPPLDLYFPEGFAFIALYGFPHVAAAQSLLLGGFLCLLRAWEATSTTGAPPPTSGAKSSIRQLEQDPYRPSALRAAIRIPHTPAIRWAGLTGLLWLLMGIIIPFYVAVAWTVAGSIWMALCLRHSGVSIRWKEGLTVGLAALISAPVVVYSARVFTSDPVYVSWAAQNQILSPHPLHYAAAYGIPLALAAFAVKETWRDMGWTWIALAWVSVVPVLVYLPVNLQRRLTTSVQVPLSVLAAAGATRLWRNGRRGLALSLLAPIIPTSLFIVASSSAWMLSRPSPSFRDTREVAAMNWLAAHSAPRDVVLTAYDTGAYLPARAHVRVLVGHNLEAMNAQKKQELVNRFFDAATDDSWRQRFLKDYGVDYVFWGPAERSVGRFDPSTAPYLRLAYMAEEYPIFTTKP